MGDDDVAVSAPTRTNINNRSLSGFMQQTANSILNAPWQIIQVGLCSHVAMQQYLHVRIYVYSRLRT